MKRIQINELEQITSEDLNNAQKTVHESLYDKTLRKFFQDEDGVLGGSFLVARTSATTVSVAAGRAFLYDATQVSPEPKYRAIQLDSGITLTIGSGTWAAAPSAPNNRIDIICIRPDENVITTETRKVKVGGVATDTVVDKILEQQYEIQVVEGVAAVSPSAPATPAGWLKIAQITVTGGSNIASANDVIDSRNILQPVFDSINADTRVVSPTGNGTDSTLASAISNLPAGGGSILILEDLTLSSTVTVNDNTLIKGRSREIMIALASGGKIVVDGDDCKLENLIIKTAQASLPKLVQVDGDRCIISDCLFDMPVAGTNTAIDFNGADPDLRDCDFLNTTDTGGTNTRYDLPSTSLLFRNRAQSLRPDVDVVALSTGDYSGESGIIMVPQFPWASPTKLSNPASLPASTVFALAFSPGGEYLAVAYSGSNALIIYQRNGTEFVKLTDPVSLPAGFASVGLDWSKDARFLFVGSQGTPYITIYERVGNVFTKLTNPATLPTGQANAPSMSPNTQHLAVAHNTTPFVSIYERVGTTFTKLTNPGTLPTGNGQAADWSPDGRFLAIGHEVTPFLTIYEKSAGGTFTKLTNPLTLPTSEVHDVAFSADGRYLAVAHEISPYITIYERSGNVFTKMTNPVTLPTGDAWGCKWSLSGRILAVAHLTTPFLTVYDMASGAPVKLANPGTLPPGNSNAVTISDSGEFIAVGSVTTPFVTIYQTGADMPDNARMLIKKILRAGQ